MLRRLAAFLLLLPLLLTGCFDDAPSDETIGALLETSVNQELAMAKASAGERHRNLGGEIVPDAIRIVNLRTLGAVSDSKGIHVASVQFDLLVEVNGARILNQRAAKARLKLARDGSGWRILEKQ
ncbi:hypothetical protein N825_03500 [Skermanella stibiiresistens SB22]|uniref:Lipoprotein n=1 Tax=Skermanella stibiiresistens SB22 TaxID=1385369 RepID=W9H5U2_9PROT|nr:hypothetical protein [Skermanella stibiiresistens]EWY40141.1 hypothetical protein N825_03500 [Skermanella stibiiresistens SB22]